MSERISKLPIDLNKTIVLNIDSNENIWYIFENLSLYKVPKNYELIKNLNFNLLLKNATPTSTITIGDFVYILTNDSELYSLQLKTKKLKLIKKYSNNRPLLLKQYNDKLIVCFADFMDLYKFKNNNLIHVKEILNSDYKDAIFFNNKLYYINLKEIFDDSKRRILIDSSTPRFKGLIGLNNNIIVYNEEKIISYSLLTKKRISTNALKTINLAEKSNNVIFFGTYSNGLYVLTQNLEIIQKIDFKRKSINKLYYDSTFDILYVGTNEGVFTYKVKKNKLQLT